jgi:hypothetical protein
MKAPKPHTGLQGEGGFSVYYLPRLAPEGDLAIMRRLDQLHLEFSFTSSAIAAARKPHFAISSPAAGP